MPVRTPRQEIDAGSVLTDEVRGDSVSTLPPGYEQVFGSLGMYEHDGERPAVRETEIRLREKTAEV